MGLVRRGMKGEGKSRQVFDRNGLGQVVSVSAMRRGIVTGRGAGDGRDQRADCSRRHAGTGLAQICEAVRQSGGRVRRRWAIRRGAAGHAVGPGRD